MAGKAEIICATRGKTAFKARNIFGTDRTHSGIVWHENVTHSMDVSSVMFNTSAAVGLWLGVIVTHGKWICRKDGL